MNFENYKDALFNKQKYTHTMNMLRSMHHNIYGLTVNKTTLSPLDTEIYKPRWNHDKRVWVSAGTISSSSLTKPLFGAGAFK